MEQLLKGDSGGLSPEAEAGEKPGTSGGSEQTSLEHSLPLTLNLGKAEEFILSGHLTGQLAGQLTGQLTGQMTNGVPVMTIATTADGQQTPMQQQLVATLLSQPMEILGEWTDLEAMGKAVITPHALTRGKRLTKCGVCRSCLNPRSKQACLTLRQLKNAENFATLPPSTPGGAPTLAVVVTPPSSSSGLLTPTMQSVDAKRNHVFKHVRASEKCGHCSSCLNPKSKKACLTVRARQLAEAGTYGDGNATSSGLLPSTPPAVSWDGTQVTPGALPRTLSGSKRTYRCGQCKTCLNPHLKKACLLRDTPHLEATQLVVGEGGEAILLPDTCIRKRTYSHVKRSERCGYCHTCINPQLKRACETVRAQQAMARSLPLSVASTTPQQLILGQPVGVLQWPLSQAQLIQQVQFPLGTNIEGGPVQATEFPQVDTVMVGSENALYKAGQIVAVKDEAGVEEHFNIAQLLEDVYVNKVEKTLEDETVKEVQEFTKESYAVKFLSRDDTVMLFSAQREGTVPGALIVRGLDSAEIAPGVYGLVEEEYESLVTELGEKQNLILG